MPPACLHLNSIQITTFPLSIDLSLCVALHTYYSTPATLLFFVLTAFHKHTPIRPRTCVGALSPRPPSHSYSKKAAFFPLCCRCLPLHPCLHPQSWRRRCSIPSRPPGPVDAKAASLVLCNSNQLSPNFVVSPTSLIPRSRFIFPSSAFLDQPTRLCSRIRLCNADGCDWCNLAGGPLHPGASSQLAQCFHLKLAFSSTKQVPTPRLDYVGRLTAARH